MKIVHTCDCGGPHVTTTISLATFFSFILTASSTAIYNDKIE